MSDLLQFAALVLAAITVILVGIAPIYAAHHNTDLRDQTNESSDRIY